MRKILFFTFMAIVPLLVPAQSSYKILFQNPKPEGVGNLIETTDNHKILAVGSESTAPYLKNTYRGKFWQFTNPQDTLTKTIVFGDTACGFSHIFEFQPRVYTVFGRVLLPPTYRQGALLIAKFDKDLNELEHRICHVPGWNSFTPSYLKKFGNSFYCLGTVSESDTSELHPCIVKLHADFTMDRYQVYSYAQAGNFTAITSCLLSPDSTQLWVFKDMGKGFAVFDTALNFIYTKSFPSRVNQVTWDIEVLYTGLVTAKWITDSTFLVAASNERSFNHQAVWDQALGFSEMDTTLSIVPITYIGDIDTIQYPAYFGTFDFKTTDSIFFTGTHNVIIQFWPKRPSWIMAGLLNRNLEVQYLHYYGGDAYYSAISMLLTSDGGYLVAAQRYDYLTQDYEEDVIFLKFNRQGQIVSTPGREEVCPQSIFGVFPNPAAGEFTLTLLPPQAHMQLLNMQGQVVHSQPLSKGDNLICCPHLPAGVYVCNVVSAKQTDSKKISIK